MLVSRWEFQTREHLGNHQQQDGVTQHEESPKARTGPIQHARKRIKGWKCEEYSMRQTESSSPPPEEEKRQEVFEKIYRMCEKKGDTLTEEELDKALEEL